MTLPELNTDHCYLRPWTPDDLGALQQLLADADVRRYLCDDEIFPAEQVSGLINRHLQLVEDRNAGMWFVHEKPGSPLIGFCGFLPVEGTPDIELMYGLLPQFWGRGLATEVSRAVLEHLWAQTDFERVLARTDPPNLKSVEVMKRLGMTCLSSTESMITYVLPRLGASQCGRVLSE
jgi:ribosomal-protein-alanine N-acetyltransferase